MFDRSGVTSLRGVPLLSVITSVCSAAFLLFGYDQGVMSGVVISQYWLDQMGNPSAIMIGTISALYDVGAVFGSILAAITAEKLGRKYALIVGSILLIVGCVLMGAAMERIMMMFGRIFTGLGIGYITSVAPVYQSEVCIATQRGWLMCCELTTLLFGLLLAYWINYAFYFHPGSMQWRFPLLFQIVFALYIIAVTLFLPESPRWLMFHEPQSASDAEPSRGLEILARLRNRPISDPIVQEEKEEIMRAIEIESETEGSWADLFRDGGNQGHKRFFLALGIQFMQQTSGINIVSYYAPTIFQSVLGMTQERALFVGGMLQVWYLLASFLTWYMIEVAGRRRLFVVFAIGMMLVLVAEAICVKIGTYSAGIGAVFFVFLFEGCFTWGWMATSWVYPSEILPLKLRAKGTGLAAAADFLGNFLVVEITPSAIENIGYKTYIIFAVLNVVTAIVCYLFYPETAGLSLEAIDAIFMPMEGDEEIKANRSWLEKMQWSVVAKSKVLVRNAKLERKNLRLGGSEGDAEIVTSELKDPSTRMDINQVETRSY
ncbi:MAG: hypothetical protein STHCBS139747_006152 [Sporothrix thermara]